MSVIARGLSAGSATIPQHQQEQREGLSPSDGVGAIRLRRAAQHWRALPRKRTRRVRLIALLFNFANRGDVLLRFAAISGAPPVPRPNRFGLNVVRASGGGGECDGGEQYHCDTIAEPH